MNKKPKFSVLLPTHNRADVLPFAINSVLEQTEPNFELLVVGDGCTDNTSDVVLGFNDKRMTWHDLPKSPHFGYANRNLALKQARGKYVAYMAHDDLWLPDHLELLGQLFDENPTIEMAYCHSLWVLPNGHIVPSQFDLRCPEILESFLSMQVNQITMTCVAHQKQAYEKYGYWDETLFCAGDWELSARIIREGDKQNYTYQPIPTALHFQANWRSADVAGHEFLLIWKKLSSLADFFPTHLTHHFNQSKTEQEVIWNDIEPNPIEWASNIRKAVDDLLNLKILSDNRIMLHLQEQERWASYSLRELNQKALQLNSDLAALPDELAKEKENLLESAANISAIAQSLVQITPSASVERSKWVTQTLDQIRLSNLFESLPKERMNLTPSTGMDEVVAFHQVDLDGKSDALYLNSTGEDPHVLIPEFQCAESKQCIFKIEITSPAETTLQIFYKTTKNPVYTESQSESIELVLGENIVFLEIDAADLLGPLRLDPGRTEGEYLISSIEVRSDG